MSDDCSPLRRLRPGSFTFVRYRSVSRKANDEPAMVGADPAVCRSFFLQSLGEGMAGTLSPGRWIWFSLGRHTAPEPVSGYIATDFAPSIACYEVSCAFLSQLLRQHAPAAMDCDLLSAGYRRIAFATWAIEIVIADASLPIVMVPLGHAHNFERVAAICLQLNGVETGEIAI